MSMLLGTRRALLGGMGLRYLLRATFDADDQGYADGQVLDTGAEGVQDGQLTAVEVDGTLAIVSNECAYTAQATPAWTDLGFYSQAITKALGRTFLATINRGIGNTAVTMQLDTVGAVRSPINTPTYHSLYLSAWDIRTWRGGNPTIIGVFAASTDYECAIVTGGYDVNEVPWRSGQVAALYLHGVSLYIKGGAYADWTLLWKSDADNTASLYAVFGNFNAVGTIDDFRVPDRDLSAVLQPACLSTFTAGNGTSLDAITPEVGGAWTERSGNFDIQTKRANIAVASGGRDVSTVETGIADGLFDVVIRKTAAVDSGEFGLCLRHTDANNFWMVHGDLTNNQIEIVERNGGVETLRASAAIALTHSTDYAVRAIAYSQTIDAFLDGRNKCTYTTAALNENETRQGIVGNGTGQTFENYAVFPRTSPVYESTLDRL